MLAGVGLLATSGYLISRAAQHPDILALGVAIAAVRSLAIARAMLRYGERLVSHELAFRTLADLRRRFFDRLVPLVPGGLPGVGRAQLLSRFVADVDRLQDLYLRAIAPVAVALVAGSASVLIAFLMAPAAGAVLAAGLLIGGVVVPGLTRAAARAAGRRQARDRAELTTTIVEAAGGASEIAMAGREHDWIERADRQGARLAAIQRRDALAAGLAGGLMTAVTGVTTAAVALVAIPAVRHGELAGVLLAAVSLLAMAAFEAVRPLAAAAASIDACAAAATRIEDVLAAPAPVVDPIAPVDLPRGRRPRAARRALPLRRQRPVAARRRRPAPRARPCGGARRPQRQRQDDARRAAGALPRPGAGRRRARRRRGPRRRRRTTCAPPSASAPRTPTCSPGRCARTSRSPAPARRRADLERALARVGLGPWLASLPDGLATAVGEHGAKVSGGQRRRIAAARLLLSPARFLIADEPAAHLDAGGAAALMGELAR